MMRSGRAAGFERATTASQTQRSTRLSYAPIICFNSPIERRIEVSGIISQRLVVSLVTQVS